MKKSTKILIIAGVAVDVAITVFLFVISIIMLATMAKYKNNPQAAAAASSGMIKYFILHTTAFLWLVVIPLFVLLAANIVGLVVFVKKTSKKEPAKLEDLSEEQKEALRQELLKDLQSGGEEKKE